jgi:prolyl 4-hydroxylase
VGDAGGSGEIPGPLAFRGAGGKTGPVNLTVKTKAGSPSPLRAKIGRDVAARLDANPAVKRAKTDLAQIYYAPDYFTDEECQTLVNLIDANRRPSTLLAPAQRNDYRTSESCDLDRWAPEVRAVDERICALLGVDPVNGETLQGQRYSVGQQFLAHADYFHESQAYWPAMKASGGQRTWTAMAYLNDVEEGGATWFPHAGIRVKPRKRMLVIWNNMAADGSPNEYTLHEGMAVLAGTKYVVTKWYREQAWVRSAVQTY